MLFNLLYVLICQGLFAGDKLIPIGLPFLSGDFKSVALNESELDPIILPPMVNSYRMFGYF